MIPLRDSEPSQSTPVVTIALIVVNVLVFLFTLSLDPFSRNYLIATHGVVPNQVQALSLFTSMFLHGGWLHLIGNMWFLWIFGDNIEDLLGHSKYLLFYLACGAAAALIHVGFSLGSRIPTIGASGAIAGVMGAYLIKFPRSRVLTLVPLFVFLTTIEVPAVFILVYWFIIQFFSGVGSIGYSQASQGGTAWFAHVGGFLVGMLLIYLLRTGPRYRRRRDLNW